MNPTCELLNSHRSIRKFTNQHLSEEQLSHIVHSGHRAATSSNLQARSVIRITEPEKRQTLAEIAGGQSYIISAPEFLVFCADFKHAEMCCDLQGKSMAKGMTEQFIIATVDTALMAQNCVVAAESMGLGICYIGALRNDPERVSKLLQLPEQVYPVFGLCIGYPDQDPEIKPRLSLDTIMKTDVWTPDSQEMLNAYDDELHQYYQTRTGGTKDANWTQEISSLISKESRPHMREFLKQQGFEMR